MKRSRIIIITISILIFVCGTIYLTLIPALFNCDFLKNIVINKIYQKTGFEVSLENYTAKTDLFPLNLNINADKIKLNNNPKNEFIDLDDISTTISIPSILAGKINFTKTNIKEINISVNHDYTEILTSPKIIKKLKFIKLKNLHIDKISADISGQNLIDNVKISTSKTIIDEFNINKKLKIETDIKMENAEGVGFIYLNTDLKLPLNLKNIEQSSLIANINNLNIQIVNKIVHKFYENIQNINGIIDAQIEKNNNNIFSINTNFNNLKIEFGNELPSLYQSMPLNIKSNILLDGNKVYLQYTKLTSDLIKVMSQGEINISSGKNIQNNLTISIDKSDISEIINLLPPLKNAIEEIDLCALKKYKLYGNILGHLNVQGNSLKPDILGNILVSDVYLLKPVQKAQKATVKLTFNGNSMTIDTKVPTAIGEFVKAKGRFDLYDEKRCLLNVISSNNVNLEIAQSIVNPLQDIIKLYFGPVPVMKLKGIGNINIAVSGNRIEPIINGVFNFKDSEASFNDLPHIVVKNMTGKLTFNDTDTFFKTENAELNNIPVDISGTCNLYGKFDFNADTKSQNLAALFKQIKDNSMLGDINDLLNKLNKVKGLGDIKLHIYGNLKDVHDMELNKNTFVDTDINLYSAGAKIDDMPIELSNIFGSISMQNKNLILDLFALINKSKIYINGKIKDNYANILVNAKNFRIIDLTMLLPANYQQPLLTFIKSDDFINFLPTLHTDFNAKYSGNIKNINYNDIALSGKLVSSDNKFKDVNYSIAHSNFKYSPVNIDLDGINFNSSGTISNIFSDKLHFAGNFSLKDFDLEKINVKAIKNTEILNNYVKNLEKLSGTVNIKSDSSNNNTGSYCTFKDIKIEADKKIHNILSGNLIFKNKTLTVDKVNARFFEMPVLLDGMVTFKNSKPLSYNLDIKAKPIQEFLDETYNKNAFYPIKIRGNMSLDTKIKNNNGNTYIKSDLFLDKDSSIYYLGATIGDKIDAVKINSDISINSNEIKINNINYNKLVRSLNEYENIIPLLTINGAINTLKDNTLRFNNLKIKSLMPVDAKIFNIIFRKPFMKEGMFTSDLVLNGTSVQPEILGLLDITSVSLPFFESNINNINMNFTPKYINITSKGDVVTNEVVFDAKLKNNFTPPLTAEDINIHLKELNLNEILEKLKNIEETNFKIHNELLSVQPVDYTNLIINNSTLSADKIVIDKMIAQNFKGNLQIGKDKILNVKNFEFNIADGNVNGNITHSYDNNKLHLILNLNQADAATMAETLFNIKGQIYGLANGKMDLSCIAENDKVCMSSLSGNGYFEIQNGKMPKLGSLEYLLKAGNLINSGVTGLTINSLIDLLSPLKSGEFKNINGDFTLNNGIAEDINIYSNGKDLNMYITGNYNLGTSVADFKIFGSLSKEVTTTLNKVKNFSLNTLLKTIPIARHEKENEFADDIAKIPMANEKNNIYKFFRAIINGDINENNFVKSFEWID